jgi:hypothetical protein
MSLQAALVGLMAALLATPALGETANAHAAGLQLRKPSPAGLPRLPPPVAAAAAALETHRRLPCPAGGGQEAALQAALELVRGTSNDSCYQDVACAPGWREASDAVVLLLLASESGAARFCTGGWLRTCLDCAQRLCIENCTAQTSQHDLHDFPACPALPCLPQALCSTRHTWRRASPPTASPLPTS